MSGEFDSCPADDEKCMTVREAARKMRVPVSTAYKWCSRGTRVGNTPVRLRHIRRGNCIFVPADAISEFERACTAAGLLDELGDRCPPISNSQRQADLDDLDAEADKEGI